MTTPINSDRYTGDVVSIARTGAATIRYGDKLIAITPAEAVRAGVQLGQMVSFVIGYVTGLARAVGVVVAE